MEESVNSNIKLMVRGGMYPFRFWDKEKIDPVKRPERYKELIELGYYEYNKKREVTYNR